MLQKDPEMKRHPFHEALVTVVASQAAETVMRGYAELLTSPHNARVCVVRAPSGIRHSAADTIRNLAVTGRNRINRLRMAGRHLHSAEFAPAGSRTEDPRRMRPSDDGVIAPQNRCCDRRRA